MKETGKKIVLKGVRVHNLKGVDLELDHGQLILFTGVSGSGKSSLAFNTIFVEGQRRYIESLSTYARRHLGDLVKPEADLITGISPTIAIEQKTAGKNPRSTVGTMTGIHDFLRVLFARVAVPHCPVSGEAVSPQSAQQILEGILSMREDARLAVMAPYIKGKKGEFRDEFAELMRKGYTRIRLDGHIVDLSEELKLDGKRAHDIDLVIDRILLSKEEKIRLKEAVEKALELGKGVIVVQNLESGEERLFSQYAYSTQSKISYGPLEPQDFSFNHPSGMCPGCQGLGTLLQFQLEKILNSELSIREDCCSIAPSYQTVYFGNIYENLARLFGFDLDTPWKKLSKEAQRIFLHGVEQKWLKIEFVHPVKGYTSTDYVQWRGVLHEARRRYEEAKSDSYRKKMEELMIFSICPECRGARIRPYPAAAKLGSKTLFQLTELPLEELYEFLGALKLRAVEQKIAEELLKEIRERLLFLIQVGLSYLTLERTSPTLSGGEAQRVRLAAQIGYGLSQVTYILDEPSIGLHARDQTRLIYALKKLTSQGNTVIVVEHDEETMRAADHIVDVGPLAGRFGGEILYSGDLQGLLKVKRSLTAQYLNGDRAIVRPSGDKKTPIEKWLKIVGATHHNLKNIDVDIPIEHLVAITGVSGSGKSSLIIDTLYPILANQLHHAQLSAGPCRRIEGLDALDKVIAIDQMPIGRTPRSNPATYIKLFDEIRDLFSQMPESQARGFGKGRFSFNVKEGSCSLCGGMGMVKIDMDFMEDEWVHCEECGGRRFDPATLSVRLKGKTIHDILEMTIFDASAFFEPYPKIRHKIDLLLQVGLDYLKLGQPSPTLSGGEAQRIKLAKELSRPATGRTLYILDEPTTGLHFHDIEKLIQVLHTLVKRKNSVLVIEHNMDLVKNADWVIDMGPEAGNKGGEVVAAGPPKKIAALSSPTGQALSESLSKKAIKSGKKRSASREVAVERSVDLVGARQNNLQNVSARIPHGSITVCTGPSGSGKSSFAFETVYAEGQRRFTESLSPFARQFIKQMAKPKIESIDGLLAAISIEQKSHAGNPRSTIGTMTEIYDYLRLLFAHLGTAYCPETQEEIRAISKDYVGDKLLKEHGGERVQILAPLKCRSIAEFEDLKERLRREGYLRMRLNHEFYELDNPTLSFDPKRQNSIELIIDRLVVEGSSKERLFEALEKGSQQSKGTLLIITEGGELFFNLAFTAPKSGKSYPPITPHTFSFNTASGMCPDCLGLGFQYGAQLQTENYVLKLTPLELVSLLLKDAKNRVSLRYFERVFKEIGIDPDQPIREMNQEKIRQLFYGFEEERSFKMDGLSVSFRGLNPTFAKLERSSNESIRDLVAPKLTQHLCSSCQGTRLNPLARNVRIGKLSIASLCNLPIESAHEWMEKLSLDKKGRFLEETLQQIRHRLAFLVSINLGYLSLDRSAPTLSGGETQRIKLARQLGAGLTGCLYVLDEPTVGLHPHNNALLNNCLRALSEMGNTLLLVEHDPMTIRAADYLFDFGPGAGKHGGHIVARGTLAEIQKNPDSLTGRYLNGSLQIPIPEKRRPVSDYIEIENAKLHNLQDCDVKIPTGVFTCVTGVSGSGKSTLINDLLAPAARESVQRYYEKVKTLSIGGTKISNLDQFQSVVILDQNPVGHTIRADVSTYTDLSTPLRYFFASLPEAQVRGLDARHFSSNHLKGMCKSCFGLGSRTIHLQYLPSLKVLCESCQGFRLNPLSLEVKYKGNHLGQLMRMNVEEAREWLPPLRKVGRILDRLLAVNLGYLNLGQEIATLSGGEAQRLRLSRELAKAKKGKILYLFDEPTIGLHMDDVKRLLPIFQSLVDLGHTLIIIEHNLDLIAQADYLIDLGPEAGDKGGRVVATGTPEAVAKSPISYTGKYLKEYFKQHEPLP